MQLTPVTFLISQCFGATERLTVLRDQQPGTGEFRPEWRSGLSSDLQRIYAIEWMLMLIEAKTQVVQAEVFDAISDVLETIAVTYRGGDSRPSLAGFPSCHQIADQTLRERRNRATHKGRDTKPRPNLSNVQSERTPMI